MTNEPIDILAIASQRFYEAKRWFDCTMLMNASPEATLASDMALLAVQATGQDHRAASNLAYELMEDANRLSSQS